MVEDGADARLVALLLVGLLLGPGVASAQVDFPGAPGEPGVNLRVYPLDLWSPRVGVGLGAGVVLHHLGRSNAQGLLTFAPARHEQVATAAWASANPRRARQYVMIDGRGFHTNRDWFYGVGPRSSPDARQSIERSALQAQIRTGQAFLDHRFVVQSHIGLSAHRIDRITRPSDPDLTSRSQTHLRQLSNDDLGVVGREQTGVRVGVAARFDSRPREARPTRGVRALAQWSRYLDVSSSLVRFDEIDLAVHGHLPLGGSHRLSSRLRLTLIEPRGRAPVPYYLRPTLGGSLAPGWARHRFVDSDRFIGSALYRFPLARVAKVVTLEGHLGVHAASVYGQFPSDAAFDLTFDERLDPTLTSVPLRPSTSVGVHMALSFRQAPSLDLALGVSPEGVSGVRFTFRQDILTLRPPHHDIRSY